MFFFNNCIEKNQNKTHFEEGSSSHQSMGRVRVPKLVNFRKGSKWPLTPTPHPSSEWSLSLKIMCMHFILSGPHTSLHICTHIHYKKSENSSDLVAWPFPYERSPYGNNTFQKGASLIIRPLEVSYK